MNDVWRGLTPEFASNLRALLLACATRGVTMRPYFGLRDPVTQAKLFRQSRRASQISNARAHLKAMGAPFLAACIDKAGVVPMGPWATNAMPGDSWHQWGEAMDCVWEKDGVYEWSEATGGTANGYRVYAALAPEHGLTNLGTAMGKDFGHVQLRPEGAPHQLYEWPEIDATMKMRFDGA